MKETNERLKEWAINKIKTEYACDVSLLIGYDLEKLEENIPCGPFQYFKGGFDYFVPENERAYGLAKTFIIGGIGYDLYPRSWERIEAMANLNDYNTCCLGDAQILYSRSENDRARFEGIRQRLFDNLKNPAFMFKKALEKLGVAMEIYQTMMFCENIAEVRMSAGFIADYLAVSVACINGTYFKHSQINQFDEMAAFKEVPERFSDYYNAVIQADSVGEMKNLSHLIILTTRKFLESHKPKAEPQNAPDYKSLANWYQELSYTWRRIYHRCLLGDVNKAFIWGCMLQNELNIIKEEFNLNDMDLMGSFNSGDLSPLRARAEELEKYITDTIISNGADIEAYDNVTDFLKKNG